MFARHLLLKIVIEIGLFNIDQLLSTPSGPLSLLLLSTLTLPRRTPRMPPIPPDSPLQFPNFVIIDFLQQLYTLPQLFLGDQNLRGYIHFLALVYIILLLIVIVQCLQLVCLGLQSVQLLFQVLQLGGQIVVVCFLSFLCFSYLVIYLYIYCINIGSKHQIATISSTKFLNPPNPVPHTLIPLDSTLYPLQSALQPLEQLQHIINFKIYPFNFLFHPCHLLFAFVHLGLQQIFLFVVYLVGQYVLLYFLQTALQVLAVGHF